MKKLTLSLMAMAATAIALSQSNHLEITSVKNITTEEAVTSLKVYNNMDIILTNDSTSDVRIVGEKTDVENTLVKFSNGGLNIHNTSENPVERVTVYISSKALNRVYIHGSSQVRSAGHLHNQKLDVIINGEGKSLIKSTGLISLNTVADFPLSPIII